MFRGLVDRVMSLSAPLRAVLFGLVWLALWRVAIVLEYSPHASLWFPPAGLSFAAFLVVGWRALPVVFICAVLSTFWIDQIYREGADAAQILLSGILFGASHCLAYWGGATLLRRLAIDMIHHSLPRLIIGFLAFGSVAALLAALLGTQALALTGAINPRLATTLWLPWWIGDMAGVTVLAPFFVGVIARWYPEIAPWLGGFRFPAAPKSRRAFAFKLLVCLTMLVLTMAVAARVDQREAAFAVFFLIVPQMWLVYSESAFRTAASVALFSLVTAILVQAFGLFEQALVYQFAINVIAASAYFGLAVPGLIADNQQLRRLALTDSLTNIWSRQSLIEQAQLELIRAERYRDPLSLIVFDIDRFKTINDQHGHPAGDEVLRKVAAAAQTTLRGTDLLGRYGGDEFVGVLPQTDLQQACDTAQRIRTALAEVKLASTEQNVSASFGVAEAARGESFNQIFERADRALYKAKTSGRDQVLSAETPLTPPSAESPDPSELRKK